jgi:hypothetical protein
MYFDLNINGCVLMIFISSVFSIEDGNAQNNNDSLRISRYSQSVEIGAQHFNIWDRSYHVSGTGYGDYSIIVPTAVPHFSFCNEFKLNRSQSLYTSLMLFNPKVRRTFSGYSSTGGQIIDHYVFNTTYRAVIIKVGYKISPVKSSDLALYCDLGVSSLSVKKYQNSSFYQQQPAAPIGGMGAENKFNLIDGYRNYGLYMVFFNGSFGLDAPLLEVNLGASRILKLRIKPEVSFWYPLEWKHQPLKELSTIWRVSFVAKHLRIKQ